ncbi:MAG TPA: hypothetical protein VMR33_16425 [Candidatus Baltobacteraceae bacterium]|jgi:hypothetical protein|nr:hypothetical protein [Candidatus Baltobacteraceae bacterium]
MKTLEAKINKKAELVFSVIVIIALLLLNFPGTGASILVFSAVGSAAYFFMFKDHFRDHRGR